MGLKNFKSYNLAVRFYRESVTLSGPTYLKDQLGKAASSIVLNLAEGSAKPTRKDRTRFYFTALGSQRECLAILELLNAPESMHLLCNEVGACVYALANSPKN